MSTVRDILFSRDLFPIVAGNLTHAEFGNLKRVCFRTNQLGNIYEQKVLESPVKLFRFIASMTLKAMSLFIRYRLQYNEVMDAMLSQVFKEEAERHCAFALSMLYAPRAVYLTQTKNIETTINFLLERGYCSELMRSSLTYLLPQTIGSGNGYQYKNLRGADFTTIKYLDEKQISFKYANLSEARFGKSNIFNVNFRYADLRHATLRSTYFQECSFAHADLSHAQCTFTKLVNNSLMYANLNYTNLRTAKIRFIISFDVAYWLCCAALESEEYHYDATMSGAVYNQETRFPLFFSPRAHGMITAVPSENISTVESDQELAFEQRFKINNS